MLIDVKELFPDLVWRSPIVSSTNEVIQNLERDYSKYPWFKKLYMDIDPKRQNFFVVETKEPIDIDKYPSRYDSYQIRYMWRGKRKLTINEAVKKFWERYHKEPWFSSVEAINQKYICVTLKFNKNHRWDYYENFPVQYGLEKEKLEDENRSQ